MRRTAFVPAVSVALRCGSKILLVRRGREPWKGLYAFPGGRVEEGETLDEAARRELFEETGLTARRLRLLTVLDLEAPGVSYRLHVFAADDQGQQAVAGDDAEAAGWYDLEEIGELPLTESTRAVAVELLGVQGRRE